MKDSNLLNIYSPFDGMADIITKEILGTVGLKKDLSLPTVAMLLNSDKQLRAYCKDVFLKKVNRYWQVWRCCFTYSVVAGCFIY